MDVDTALEQYKLAVEMADRVSSRRQTANAFFVTVIAALVAVSTGLIDERWPSAVTLAVVIPLICALWYEMLGSYRMLNAAKFKVIHEIERMLPFQMFADEQEHYKSFRRRRPLSRHEQYVPVIFAVIGASAPILELLA